MWHLHILSPFPSTSESFVACSKKEKMLHKLHSPRQFQASRHATVDCPLPPLPPLPLLAGRQFVSRQERSSEGNKKKRPAEVECQQLDSSNWGPSLSPSPARGSFVFGYACLGANEAAASSVSCCQCTRVSLRYNTQWSGEARELCVSLSLSLSLLANGKCSRHIFAPRHQF